MTARDNFKAIEIHPLGQKNECGYGLAEITARSARSKEDVTLTPAADAMSIRLHTGGKWTHTLHMDWTSGGSVKVWVREYGKPDTTLDYDAWCEDPMSVDLDFGGSVYSDMGKDD